VGSQHFVSYITLPVRRRWPRLCNSS